MKRLSKTLMPILQALVTGIAYAVTIVPGSDSFGSLPAATFGGSGIPNDAVAISTSGGITLGLTATQRFSAPALTNNGAGTFFAQAGTAGGASLWDFSFYASPAAGTEIADLTFELLYDFNPGAMTDEADHGVINLTGFAAALGGLGPTDPHPLVEDSQNLTFGLLAVATPGLLIPPTSGAFDPFAAGEYTFSLRARDRTGTLLANSSIAVNIVPEPTTIVLALAGLGLLGRSRRTA